MDDLFRRRKQNENAMRPTSNPRYQQAGQDASQQRRSHQSGSSRADQQRSTSSGARGLSSGSGSASYGGYYHESATGAFPSGGPHGAMGFPQSAADYGQDARQSQGFAGAYNPTPAGMMYNVQQTGEQNPVFDATQSYSSRQHGGMQIMGAGVNPSASYFSGDTSAVASVPMHAQGAQTGPSSAVYQQQQHQAPSDNRSGIVTGYTSSMGTIPGATSLASHTTTSSNPDPSASSAAATAAGSQDYADTHESYVSYQRTLKEVFRNIKNGSLSPASESLLGISDWLLSRVESLGLTVDDEDLYEGRVKLWTNFNNAWLALLEKQKEMMWSGKKLQRSQSLISLDDLQNMARELVRLCDGVERFGLVDYDYGVWEERIMAVLTECVDLFGMAEEEDSNAGEGSSSRQG